VRTARQVRSDAKRLWRLCLVNGSLDESRAREIVDQLIARGYSGVGPILSHFLRLLKLDRARHTAQVESAEPLAPDVRAAVEEGLARKYPPAMTTIFVVDPGLIGGMRVQVGSDVYDGSVRAGLDALEARF